MLQRTGSWPVFVSAIGFVLLWNCGDKSPTGSSAPTDADITGKWNFTQRHTRGTAQVKIPPIMDTTITIDTTIMFTGNNDYLNLYGTKTYTKRIIEGFIVENDTGTWSLSGNQLTVQSGGGAKTASYTVGINGKNGTFVSVVSDSINVGLMVVPYSGTETISAVKE